MKQKQGFIKTKNGKVWYEVVGGGNDTPLFVVNGGPGLSHNYLSPLRDLANKQPIIFYDQIGTGKSENLENPSKWKPATFIDELGEITKHLSLKKFHLLGQSWGAAVVAGFAIKKPQNLQSIIFSDPYLSAPIWVKDAQKLIKKLPQQTQAVLKSNNQDSENYKKASKEYYDRYVRRLKIVPDDIKNGQMNKEMYLRMWGPNEFSLTGSLKDFDLSKELFLINVPTLFIAGKYDEATPEAMKYFSSKIKKSQVKIFNNSAHFPFWSERKDFMATVKEFLYK